MVMTSVKHEMPVIPDHNCRNGRCNLLCSAVQAFWLVIPLLVLAGAGAYALCKRHSKGDGGDGIESATGSADRGGTTGGSAPREEPAVGSTSTTAGKHTAPASQPRASNSSTTQAAPEAATSKPPHDELPDPRHVRHVNISDSFMSAASAFQTEE